MTATLAQACLDGNLELVQQILDTSTDSIDARDEAGVSPLEHAIKGNHVDIVSLLLSKGASASQVMEQDMVKNNPELAQLISKTVKHTQSAVFQVAPVVDSYGGKQMPDGSVSYVQAPAEQQTQTATDMQQQQQAYAQQPQQNAYEQSPDQQHAGKDTPAGTLPPPEVARLIPCRFFPNCRYGDKCLFAHPMPLSNGSASSQGPVSPNQAPMYYPAPNYGYPAYGPPQHFYSMAPPMPIQYSHSGMPMPIHMPPHAQHMTASDSNGAGQSDAFNSHYASQVQNHYMPNGAQYEQNAESPALNGTASHETAEAAKEPTSEAEPSESAQASAEPKASSQQNNEQQPQHAQQQQSQQHQPTSFSAFMTHHAVPFQPGQMPFPGAPMGIDSAILAGSQSFTRGNKGSRRGGPSAGGYGSRSEFNSNNANGSSGSSKRSAERPACLFFARSACKHGEDCRFPHILPDGTDARGPNAGRSSQSMESSRGINRALAAKNARSSANGNGNGNHHSQPVNVIPSTSQASAHTTVAPASEDDIAASQDSTPVESSTVDVVESQKVETESTSVPDAVLPAASTAAATDAEAPHGSAAVDGADATSATKRAASSSRDDSKSGSGERTPAPIPSKPILNGQTPSQSNGKSHTGSKPQANGASKGQSQHGGPRGNANGRPNGGNAPRANGNGSAGFQMPRKLNSQRLPQPDDFPALSNVPAPNAAPSSTVPAPVTKGATKVNFSAILSAPAPVKKQVEAKEEPVAAAEKPQEAKVTDDLSSSTDTESTSLPVHAETNRTPVPDFASIVAKPVAV